MDGERVQPSLSDGTVTLRLFTVADTDRHLAGEDAELRRWLSGGASTDDSVRRWILRTREQWRDGGPALTFAVCQGARVVGLVEANIDGTGIGGLRPGDANVSYGLYPGHRGNGYATRAVLLVERFLADRGVRRAVIRVHPDNVASVKVAERLGYVDGGVVAGCDGQPLRLYVKGLDGVGDHRVTSYDQR